MKVNKISHIIIVLFSLIALQSCNEEPTGLGFLLLNDTIGVKSVCSDRDDVIISTETVTVPKVIFNSSVTYIGKTDSMRAVTMLRFQYIPDSLADLPLEDITECYIELYPNRYAIGDTVSNNLSFKVYKIIKYWTNKTTCDSLFDDNGNSDYFDDVVQGTYSTPIPYDDSSKAIKFNLNKELLLEWFAMARDSVINWGIAFVPDDNSNVIRQFSAQAVGEELKRAEITMTYRDTDSTRTLKINTGIDASVVCFKMPDTDNFIVQGGIINKSRISFDLSSIPPTSGILAADLEITLNSDFVRKGNYPLDSVVRGNIYYGNDIDSNPRVTFFGYRLANSNVFRFPKITSLVEEAIRGNGKAELIIEPEGWSIVRRLDRMPFYGINEKDPNLRPKLRVVYSSGFRDR